MKKIITHTLLLSSLLFGALSVSVGTKTTSASALTTLTSPLSAVAATNCDLQPRGFVVSKAIFTPWFKYLDGTSVNGGPCRPDFSSSNFGRTFIRIGAAIIELLLNLSALIAAGFIIFGSIQYVISQGEPTALSSAKSTITNAIVGLVITILASGIVQFIGSAIKRAG